MMRRTLFVARVSAFARERMRSTAEGVYLASVERTTAFTRWFSRRQGQGMSRALRFNDRVKRAEEAKEQHDTR